MMRMVFAATNSANSARTTRTMRAATEGFLSRSIDEGGRPADLDDMDAFACLGVVDALDHGRRLADECGRAGAQMRRHGQVAAGDRAHEQEHRERPGEE